MVVYKLNGIDVYFPFDAYPSQLEYMHLLLDCFQRKQNGLLESPTGTGKTLSILCATLSWLSQTEKSHRTKFYYASRTHSQLAQVSLHLKSLLSTRYKGLRMCILGSRDQLCIHPIVCQKSGYSRVVACRSLIRHSGCRYYHKSFSQSSKQRTDIVEHIPESIDIEDLLKLGREQNFCPYYLATTDLCQQADIILLPYNYILEARLRRIHNIDITNSIIAIDEAHNIEDVCEDACSAEICPNDIQKILETSDFNLMGDVNSSIDPDLIATINDNIKANLNALLVNLNSIPQSIRLPGSNLIDKFNKCDISAGILEKLEQWNPKDDKLSTYLNKITCFLEAVLSSRNAGFSFCLLYDGETIKYYCLSAAFAMGRLSTAHSIILTSGTLGCFNTLASCLGISFPVQQKFDHILEEERLIVLPIGKGPDGSELRFSYNERSKENTLISLGRTILNLSRILPYGFLIFFTSYKVLSMAMSQWTTNRDSRNKNLWQNISEIKPIFVESRESCEFEEIMSNFRKDAQEIKGAIFLAVTRGRASEGLDFAGNSARTVMMVGLPYAPRFDHKLQAKMQLLDEQRMGNSKFVSGQSWYEQKMHKAIGQAVGRLIRSKNDYGVLILLDSRFSSLSIQDKLPVWIKRSIQKPESFGVIIRMITMFFKTSKKWQMVDKPVLDKPNRVDLIQPPDLHDSKVPIRQMINRKRQLPHDNDAYDTSSVFRNLESCDKVPPSLLSFLSNDSNTKSSKVVVPAQPKDISTFEDIVEQRRCQMKARKASSSLLSKAKRILAEEEFRAFSCALGNYHKNDSSKYDTFREFFEIIIDIFGIENREFILMLKPFICADFWQEFENVYLKFFKNNLEQFYALNSKLLMELDDRH